MFNEPTLEQENKKIGEFAEFDKSYFEELEGSDGWLALGDDFYENQKYFTVFSDKGDKLGIVGVYDTAEEKNVTHTVVDPKYRGQGLAAKFKEKLMTDLNLDFLTLTIDLDNEASIRAAEKLPGVKRVSDEAYEKEFHKAKYIYEKQKED